MEYTVTLHFFTSLNNIFLYLKLQKFKILGLQKLKMILKVLENEVDELKLCLSDGSEWRSD